MRIWLPTLALLLLALAAAPLAAQDVAQNNQAPEQLAANMIGTVTDVANSTVSGATVVIEGSGPGDRHNATTNDRGFFEIHDLKPGVSYHVTVSAKGFADWTSPPIVLVAGQYKILTGAVLRVAEVKTTVDVGYAAEQIAAEQVKVEVQQRIFGIIPNFYVVYDAHPAPLTAKLKFKLALKISYDPVTIAGILFFAGIDQAARRPDYVEGWRGYGERVGATAADGLSDIFIGGAVLPALLHQDPRYFYQGTGTNRSRALHAIDSAFICTGDNGRKQPNYSTIGGDLASSALSDLYYPPQNRGAGMIFENLGISTGERMAANLVQEFVLRKLTKVKNKK